MWIVGFTGTQEGMTGQQESKLTKLLSVISDLYGRSEFHHGDCIGADAMAHTIAIRLEYNIVVHPPINEVKRAHVINYKHIHTPKEYIARNHAIVDACDVLLATPKTINEELRSGTWATVRYARKQRKTAIVIYPNGSTRTHIPPQLVNEEQEG